jgi:hypothetical protein
MPLPKGVHNLINLQSRPSMPCKNLSSMLGPATEGFIHELHWANTHFEPGWFQQPGHVERQIKKGFVFSMTD